MKKMIMLVLMGMSLAGYADTGVTDSTKKKLASLLETTINKALKSGDVEYRDLDQLYYLRLNNNVTAHLLNIHPSKHLLDQNDKILREVVITNDLNSNMYYLSELLGEEKVKILHKKIEDVIQGKIVKVELNKKKNRFTDLYKALVNE